MNRNQNYDIAMKYINKTGRSVADDRCDLDLMPIITNDPAAGGPLETVERRLLSESHAAKRIPNN